MQALSTSVFGSVHTLRASAPAPVHSMRMITVGKTIMQVRTRMMMMTQGVKPGGSNCA